MNSENENDNLSVDMIKEKKNSLDTDKPNINFDDKNDNINILYNIYSENINQSIDIKNKKENSSDYCMDEYNSNQINLSKSII